MVQGESQFGSSNALLQIFPPPAVNISQSIFKPINKAHLHFAREIAGCTVHLKCNEPWENSGFYRFSIIEVFRFEKKVCFPIQFLFCSQII